MFNKNLPEASDEDNNLTDTNGAPGVMDEDGDEIVEESDEDTSPLIQRLTIAVYHPAKSEGVQTDICAIIHTAQGLLEKRTVVAGNITAKRLGAILAGIASW